MFSIPKSRHIVAVSALILVQGAFGYYLNARAEYVPPVQPLQNLPAAVGTWSMMREYTIEPEVQNVLRADDTLSRDYTGMGGTALANLFIAFFKSQRAGVAPHSPKNCLPGNGWVSERRDIIPVNVPGSPEPVEANLFVVQKGEAKSVVIYWYQSHSRVVASEYKAKFFVVADAIRLNRTDTALVKVTMPVGPAGVEATTKSAIDFVQQFFGPISRILPN